MSNIFLASGLRGYEVYMKCYGCDHSIEKQQVGYGTSLDDLFSFFC
jgi:hypothetical protein